MGGTTGREPPGNGQRQRSALEVFEWYGQGERPVRPLVHRPGHVGALAHGRRVGADTRHPSQPMAYVAQRLLVRVEPELALGVEVAAVPQAGDRREVVR